MCGTRVSSSGRVRAGLPARGYDPWSAKVMPARNVRAVCCCHLSLLCERRSERTRTHAFNWLAGWLAGALGSVTEIHSTWTMPYLLYSGTCGSNLPCHGQLQGAHARKQGDGIGERHCSVALLPSPNDMPTVPWHRPVPNAGESCVSPTWYAQS